MSRKQDNRYTSRPRALTTHFGSSPLLGSQYNPYSSNFSSSFGSKSYRNYNPYSAGFGRTSNLGIYGGTSSGYGGVYLNGPGVLSSLNLMSPILKNLDRKLVASQKNFKPKEIVPLKVKEPVAPEVPPVRPERKPRTVNRSHSFNKEKSRSLTSLDDVGTLTSRSISLNSLNSDGYCSGSERTSEVETPASAHNNASTAAAAVGTADERDYKALYEASNAEVRRLRELLNTSEQQLRDARSTISRLTRMSQSSLSEIEKREKRAMERKLSEMEEELKQLQKLKAENERLRAENRALTRVVSKLTNSAGI